MGAVSGVGVLLGRTVGVLTYVALPAQEVMCEAQGLTGKMNPLAELAMHAV